MSGALATTIRRWRTNASEILGINRRNLEYLYPRNPRARFPLVDDKIRAKEIFESIGLAVPRTFATADTRREITSALAALEGVEQFIVKPARGFGGAGIWSERSLDVAARREALTFHMAAILSGMFSLDAERDRVLVEELVQEHEALKALHGDTGVSDIRVIVCDGRAVMAMLRVPCRESMPTANLHRGGIGIGIDPATGRTTHAVRRGSLVHTHPDTGAPLAGVDVPFFREAVDMAERLNEAFGLGYLGADVVVDAVRGPLMLEVNARPGLNIQIANLRGLRPALRESAAAARREECE